MRSRRPLLTPPAATPPFSLTSKVGFVLSLCLPYVVASSPLPESTYQNSTFILPPESYSTYHIPHSPLAARFLGIGRDSPDVSVARLDATGYYVVPDGLVILQQSFNAGFIVLSYAIAFVGSLCTLELLIRRTNNNGWRNRVLLASAGMCFGGVSTFAMHFVFNNSLSLYHPFADDDSRYAKIHLDYNPGFTILSLVASMLAMTLAFFIMGTNLQDWWCCPGRRKRLESKKTGVDEYKRWKSAHKGYAKSEYRVGALLETAGRVAKWSLVDTGGNEYSSRSTSGKGSHGSWTNLKRKGGKGEKIWDEMDLPEGEDDIIRRDKDLGELDFRLGRSAVKHELERRNASPPLINDDTPNSSGNTSLPVTPLPVFHSPYRRGSMPIPDHSEQIFTPGFDFPSRVDLSSTASLIVTSPVSAPVSAGLSSPWKENSQPALGFDSNRRRASVPTIFLGAKEPVTLRNEPSLSRIQSLPEPEHEPEHEQHHEMDALKQSSPKRLSQASKSLAHSPTLSITAQLNTVGHTIEEQPEPKRSHQSRKAKNKVERFLGFDVVTQGEIVKIFITGTIAGFGVAAMHYIGQLSITGMPFIAYKARFVVASIIIASGAVIIALYIMFIMLRPKLKHTLWSKLAVAVILAAAVCLMHFTGMMGTIYGWPVDHPINKQDMMTGTNVAITGLVTALAFSACVGCAVFFAVSSWNLRRERMRRRRVVVAAVFLDNHDRILVNSTDGMLPMCDIASLAGSNDQPGSKISSAVRSSSASGSTDNTVLGMDLTTGHEAFISAVKMSWGWKAGQTPTAAALTNDAIKNQSAMTAVAGEIRRGSHGTLNSSVVGNRPVRLSIAKFLEMFGNAADQLAARVTGHAQGIARLGVLYDQILTTQSNDTVSKGQLIFLVRRIPSSEEQTDLLSRNFIFADPNAVATSLHKMLSVPLEHTTPLVNDITLWADSTARPALKPNTLYAGVAVVQATPFDGLRILLEQENRSQLPMRELCNFSTSPLAAEDDELYGTVEEMAEAVTWLEGMSLMSVITRNMTVNSSNRQSIGSNATSSDHGSANELGGPRVTKLLLALERAIVPMLDDNLTSEDMRYILPRLTLHPVLVPLTPGANIPPGRGIKYTPPYLIVFYANYDAAVNTFTDKWLPFNLFRAQNSCVMSGSITAASRLEIAAGAHSPLHGGGGGEGFSTGRRPSKVQFEFPPTTANSNGDNLNANTSSTNTTPTSVHQTLPPSSSSNLAPTSTPFADYSFPPKSPSLMPQSQGLSPIPSRLNTNTSQHQNPFQPTHSHSLSQSSMTIPSPTSPFNRTTLTSTPNQNQTQGFTFGNSPSIHNGQPRRSSLANKSRFEHSLSMNHHHLDDGQRSTVSPRTYPLNNNGVGSGNTRAGEADWDPDWLLVLLRAKLRAET